MRLSYLKMSGFRGVKDSIDLSLSPGFVVITGRNGTGKTTICDAIEYGLTGCIRSNVSRKEKGEAITDYLWWRGSGEPKDRYVTVGFVDEAGRAFGITRTPKGVSASDCESLEKLLCDQRVAPPECLKQLCRTTILRAEEITQLSLDLPETERFGFVLSALGTTDFSNAEEKAKDLVNKLKNMYADLERRYDLARQKINDVTGRLSEAKSQTSKYKSISGAEELIKKILDLESSDVPDLLETVRKAISGLRVQTNNLIHVQKDVASLDKRRREIESASFKEDLGKIENQMDELENQLREVDGEMEGLEKAIHEEERQTPRLASLAELYEQGRRLGLEDGRCPLCGSSVAETDYDKHLLQLEQSVKNASDVMTSLVESRSNAVKRKYELQTTLESVKRKYEDLSHSKEIIDREIEVLQKAAEESGFKDQPLVSDLLSDYVEDNRKRIQGLEKALASLEVSRAYEQMAELENEVKAAKKHRIEIEQRMMKVHHALRQGKDALALIRRVSGEMIDERLAELSPLMEELYFRLRPHVDWQEVKYCIRGDVRRFLSFEVGDGLNPSFFFSSGQRRAAGLAFLLAIHLSRTWCNLSTLILDDPVQHIDDFRALHLTEVLAAIRQSGRHVICTAEDPSLAELLCRRLRSEEGSEGCLVDMDYNSEVGVHLSSVRNIHPTVHKILMSA